MHEGADIFFLISASFFSSSARETPFSVTAVTAIAKPMETNEFFFALAGSGDLIAEVDLTAVRTPDATFYTCKQEERIPPSLRPLPHRCKTDAFTTYTRKA